MTNIFITGASGLIGSAVLYEALQLDTDCVWVALIRGANVESARSKLTDELKRFCSLSSANKLIKKVKIIIGDLADISVHEDFF